MVLKCWNLLDHKPEIIFTTAFDQYAIKAFEVNATDYLLKPFSPERFNEALNKAIEKVQQNDKGQADYENLITTINNSKEYYRQNCCKGKSKNYNYTRK